MLIGAGMFGGLLLLLALGVPIAFALLFVALAALFITGGGRDALSLISSTYWSSVATFTLTSVPMFMFMGAIVSASGMGARLYAALATILDGVPGGLAVATTIACGVMAAVSGSSVATAAAIGGFAIAEMRRHDVPARKRAARWRRRHARHPVAAEHPVDRLQRDRAAVDRPPVPRDARARPDHGRRVRAYQIDARAAARTPRDTERRTSARQSRERVVALKDIGPFALLIVIILGSLYSGLATPQEAASLGIVASLLLAGLVYRELNWPQVPRHPGQYRAQQRDDPCGDRVGDRVRLRDDDEPGRHGADQRRRHAPTWRRGYCSSASTCC